MGKDVKFANPAREQKELSIPALGNLKTKW